MDLLMVQLLPCPLHMAPGDERASNLFLTTTEVLDNYAEVPTEPPVVWKDLTPSVSS